MERVEGLEWCEEVVVGVEATVVAFEQCTGSTKSEVVVRSWLTMEAKLRIRADSGSRRYDAFVPTQLATELGADNDAGCVGLSGPHGAYYRRSRRRAEGAALDRAREREGADTALLDEGQRFQGCALLARCWQKAALGGACAGGGRLSLESVKEAMYLFMDVSTRRTMLSRAYKPMRDTRRWGAYAVNVAYT